MNLSLDADVGGTMGPDRRETTVEVNYRTPTGTADASRSIVLVVDCSGSMKRPEDKIERAREGIIEVLDHLDADDKVSIIGFSKRPDTVLKLTRWGDADQAQVRENVTGTGGASYDGELNALGSTDIVRALKAAKDEFEARGSDTHAVREVVLLSDGRDQRPMEEYKEIAQKLDDAGASITSGGIGNYKEERLLTLANESGGSAYDLKNSDAIRKFLEERVIEAGKVAAPDPEIVISTTSEFYVDRDSSVYFETPETQEQAVRDDESAAVINAPRVVPDTTYRLSFVLFGTPQPTGDTYDAGTIQIRDAQSTLAEAPIRVTYEDDPRSKEAVNKRREKARQTRKIVDEDADSAAVKQAIDDMEQKGWDDTADVLKERLDTSEEAGGKVRITKEDT